MRIVTVGPTDNPDDRHADIKPKPCLPYSNLFPLQPPPMCNDIGCPDGYEPIANAWEVECLGGECKVEQCCDAMCASYACPGYFVPIADAADVFCNGGVCTLQQCCDHNEVRRRCMYDRLPCLGVRESVELPRENIAILWLFQLVRCRIKTSIRSI